MGLSASFSVRLNISANSNIIKQSEPNEVEKAVETALRLGYRHIDAAAVYGNEAEVGNGIKASSVDRKDIFVCAMLPGFYVNFG